MNNKSAAWIFGFAVLLAGLGQPAAAQEAGGPGSDDRFVIEREQNGFLRLDRKTGALSFCRVKESGLSCVASAEERAAWDAEIARLEDRIEGIERELAARGSGGESGSTENGDQNQTAPGNGSRRDQEAEAELDRALDLAERAWRRFADMIRQMKGELERKDPAK